MHTLDPHSPNYRDPQDVDLVANWLKKDPPRWIAGAFSGIFAGLLSLFVAMLLCSASGYEFWFAAKFAALPILGPKATEVGFQLAPIVLGAVTYVFLCMVLGVVYAHFTVTTALSSLLGYGLVWGAFTWIFIFNLFIQSFTAVYHHRASSALAFPVCMVFGLALASLSVFDPMIRGKR